MDPRLQHGIDLFNRREFFVCHEVLEEIWTPERGPRRLFLQSLIHFAVAFYHDQRGNPVGATLQIESTPGKGTTIFLRMAVPGASATKS